MPKPDFSPSLREGEACRVAPDLLHPTQFGVGMEEVRWRSDKLRRMDRSTRSEYLAEREAPLVIGPGGRPYIIDRHHLARSILEAAPTHRLHGHIIAAWSDLKPPAFWQRMDERDWVWRFDCDGRGPRPYDAIPDSLSALGDDYYRSLAWAIRERDAVRKTLIPFAEFRWAMWLREVMPHPTRHFEADVAACMVFARDDAARSLPGWRG